MENWKTIKEAPDYSISNIGRVRRDKPDWQGKYAGRILKPAPQRGGYLAHVLCVDGRKITRKVHRLVCEAFNGPSPSTKYHAAHIDGDVTNNIPDNPYWATAKENAGDRDRHGRTHRGPIPNARRVRGDAHWTRTNPEKVCRGDSHYAKASPDRVPRGERRHNAKMTEAIVKEILDTPRVHGSGRMLAEKFGVTMGLITAIRNGRAWTHIKKDKEPARPHGA